MRAGLPGRPHLCRAYGTLERWVSARAQAPASRLPTMVRGSATHLRQLKPDGLGAVGGAIVEFQAREPLFIQGAQQVQLTQVPQGDGAVRCLGAAETQSLVPPREGRGGVGGREGWHRAWPTWELGSMRMRRWRFSPRRPGPGRVCWLVRSTT